MEEDENGRQNTLLSTSETIEYSSDAQNSSSSNPAWLTHISRLPTQQLPHAPASFVYESIQHASNQLPSSPSSSDPPAADTYVLLNHHPAYTSSLDPALTNGPRRETPSANNVSPSSGQLLPGSMIPSQLHQVPRPLKLPNRSEEPRDENFPDTPFRNPQQESLSSSIHVASNSTDHNSDQTFSQNFATADAHPSQYELLLPNTYRQIWPSDSTLSDTPSPHVALMGYSSQWGGPNPWQRNLRASRFPLAPQNVEYEDQVSHVSDSTYGINNHQMNTSPPTAAYGPILHPIPIDHQVPNTTRDDQASEAANSPEVDSMNETSQAAPTALRKRKRSENDEDTRATKRRTGKKGRPRGKRNLEGPRSVLDPGLEFSRLYSAAMDAFIEDNDAAKAQLMILEAIGLNPEIFAAHSLLADIYFSQGDHEAAIDALMVGLHAHVNDVELWRQVADTILNDHTEGYQKRVERAMYCFSGILRKNSKDLDARFQRAECARVLGNWSKAFSDLNILLQDDPHNSIVLAQFMRVCQGVGDISQAKVLYEDHFDYFRTVGISEDDHFTWQDISNYVDILTQIGQNAKAVSEFKRLARWLCGREAETFWDDYVDDDREFDQTHYPRRLEVQQFEPDKFTEQDYGEAVPLDLRGKLGVLRLKLNFREEAQAHFDWLEPDLEGEDSLVYEYSDTFLEIATGLLDVKEYKIALRFFDAIHKADIDPGYDFWLGLAACCYVCGRKDEAIQHYEHALEINPHSIEPKTQLAKLYRDSGDRTKALQYGREAVLMAQNAIPATMNRKYERKEQRLIREAAVKALQMAYKMPVAPGKAPGRVPDDLKRGRRSRKFVKYVPRYTERPETIEPSSSSSSSSEAGNDVEEEEEMEEDAEKLDFDNNDQEAVKAGDKRKGSKGTISGRRKKGAEKTKPPKPVRVYTDRRKSKPNKPKRRLPGQEDTVKHYDEMQQLYRTLLNHQDAMREGDDAATVTWMECADVLVRDFRTVKAFYPAERHKKLEVSYRDFPLPPAGLTPIQTRIENPRQSISHNQPEDRMASPSNAAPQEEKANLGGWLYNDYCGIPFPAWLDIHLEFALLIANSTNRTSDTQKDCYDVLTSTTDCAIYYHDERSMVQIHMCWLVCALSLGDDVTLFNHVLRWFMREFAFCTDTYRLYCAISFLNELPLSSNGKAGQMQAAEFKSSPNQKFIFRQLVSIDKLLPADYNAGGAEGGVPAFMRRHREELRKISRNVELESVPMDGLSRHSANNVPLTTGGEDPNNGMPDVGDILLNDPIDLASPNPPGPPGRGRQQSTVAVKVVRPKEMDVVLFVLYAHILMASNSFTNALSYLYRAYCVDPTNPVVLLSISFCYLHELFKRQNENRHMYVLYGWAWFGRYETERLAWAERFDKESEITRHEPSEQNQNASTSAENENLKKSSRMIDVVKNEIEFNKARCWEMLGMADLAIRGYEKILSPSVPPPSKADGVVAEVNGDRTTKSEDWSMEAAYAMSTIYAINGNIGKAREITERYLVVE